MINSEIFSIKFTELSEYFGKKLDRDQFNVLKEILSEELDTHEFMAACKNAIRDCPFFPTPRWLIDSVLGTLEERALIELQNLDRLSEVGRLAFNAIGGSWAYKNSQNQEFLKKDFVKEYLALAKNMPPDAARCPAEPLKSLEGTITPKHFDPTPQGYDMPLWEKLEMLKCKRRVKGLREAAEIEARAFGFRITEESFFLGQGHDRNQPISTITLEVSHLVNLFTKTGKAPVGIINTQFEREVDF